MKKIFDQFKYPRFLKPGIFIGYCCLLFLFTTCKKEIAREDNSASCIRYFDGGTKDNVNTIEKTSDGGFIYCGYSHADSARSDAFLMKVDGDGHQQWYKTYGGANFDEFRHAIQTSDGGYIAVGQTNSIGFGTVDKTYKLSDYVVKINAEGNVEWTKSYLNAQGCLTNIFETPNHHFIITGYYYPNTYDMVLVEIDATGIVILGRSYPSLVNYPPFYINNNYDEYGQCVTLANDGSVIIGGVMSKSNRTTEAQGHVTFLTKLNINSIPEFFYPFYDFMRGTAYLQGFGVIQKRLATVKIINLNDGYLIGTFMEEPGTQIIKMQLLKTSLSGELQWHKEYSGLGNALLFNMEANPDGTVLLIGSSSSMPLSWQFTELFYNLKTMLLKVDKDGNEIWTQYIGSDKNTNYSKCVQPLPNGGWRIAGYTSSNETSFDVMWWMKVDKDGKLLTDN